MGERRRERYAKSHTLRNDIFGESPYIYHCGDVSGEVPPVPIPNTEVKLISVENTWLATAWEDRTVPVQITERSKTFSAYCSLAQSVERMTVNHDVVSSSLTGAAK